MKMEREIVRDGWRAMKRSQGRADSSRVEILALISHHSIRYLSDERLQIRKILGWRFWKNFIPAWKYFC